ncbi:MAG: outer membrane beta-barrel protein [Natronospirillum sp.]
MLKKTLVVALVMASGFAHAERNKFVLAAGLGYSVNTFDVSLDSGELETEADNGLVTSFKIGGMINQQHAVYVARQTATVGFEVEGGNSFSGGRNSLVGVGYTFYVNPTIGSPYVEVAAGFGSYNIEDGLLDLKSSGTAFLAGAGYEINKNFQVGATYSINETENDNADGESYSLTSIALKAELKI